MANWKEIQLEETCSACPEQYDAYYNGVQIGYLRLRHGYFRAEYLNEVVYSSNTIGDGSFEYDERKKHLKKAKKAIFKAFSKDSKHGNTIHLMYQSELDKIDNISQTQSSLKDQLQVLYTFANKLGLYDAATFINRD